MRELVDLVVRVLRAWLSVCVECSRHSSDSRLSSLPANRVLTCFESLSRYQIREEVNSLDGQIRADVGYEELCKIRLKAFPKDCRLQRGDLKRSKKEKGRSYRYIESVERGGGGLHEDDPF